jgi:hypothetical protein
MDDLQLDEEIAELLKQHGYQAEFLDDYKRLSKVVAQSAALDKRLKSIDYALNGLLEEIEDQRQTATADRQLKRWHL